MGTTGNSTGVHLHIGLYQNSGRWGYGSSTDILPYLGKKASTSSSSGISGGLSLLDLLFGKKS